MDWNLLEERGGDLIATTACLGGIISQDLLAGRYEEAWQRLDRMKAVFGDRLYLEIQPNELADQIRLNQMLVLASEAFGIPLVVATDSHYPLGRRQAAARPVDAVPYRRRQGRLLALFRHAGR